jgi:hypothetical protein
MCGVQKAAESTSNDAQETSWALRATEKSLAAGDRIYGFQSSQHCVYIQAVLHARKLDHWRTNVGFIVFEWFLTATRSVYK